MGQDFLDIQYDKEQPWSAMERFILKNKKNLIFDSYLKEILYNNVTM